jgi:hypothetical protein
MRDLSKKSISEYQLSSIQSRIFERKIIGNRQEFIADYLTIFFLDKFKKENRD